MAKRISNQKITPNLWFNLQAEEAVNFYTGIFNNSQVVRTAYYGTEGYEIHGMKEGTVLTVEFLLDGQEFVALNGGPHFKFNEAVSFIVNCDNQQEVDFYWEKLSAGGDPKAQVCGWLKDKYGVSWQVVPVQVTDWMLHPDKNKVNKLMAAMFKMKKLDIETLQAAFNS